MTEVQNLAGGRLPPIQFEKIKNSALGKKYSLSVVFVTPKGSRKFNMMYRKKNNPTNILSFEYSKNSGEIILCPEKIKMEAREQKKSYAHYVIYLYIHGLMHLAGLDHGDEMENREEFLRKKFL